MAKGVPTLKVTASRQVKRGKRAMVRVTLTAPGGVPVTGTVQVKVGGRTLIGTVRDGAVCFRLPRATKVGSTRVTVTYRGSSTLGYGDQDGHRPGRPLTTCLHPTPTRDRS